MLTHAASRSGNQQVIDMGPFPHNAPKAKIDEYNVAGTDGFEFVEFAHPDPAALDDLFRRMGYAEVARH